MLKKKSAVLMVVAMALGSLFAQGVEGGCWNIGTDALMTSIKPCNILNCGAGIFGPNGPLSLCGQPGNAADDVVAGCP